MDYFQWCFSWAMPTVTGKSQSCFAKMNNLFICQHASWKYKVCGSLWVGSFFICTARCKFLCPPAGRLEINQGEFCCGMLKLWIDWRIRYTGEFWFGGFFFSFNDKWNGYFFKNIFIPVTHHFIFFRSVDGILNPTIKNSHVPKWNYVLLRFQVN